MDMSVSSSSIGSFSTNNDPIQSSTRKKLKELGIFDSSIKTETQAQTAIKQKENEIKKNEEKKAQEKMKKQQATSNDPNAFMLSSEIQSNYNKYRFLNF